MNALFLWIIAHYEEILGTLFSLIYLYFSIKQNIWLWPLGLISSAIYVYVFLKAGIYADMALQVYYVVISIYGWYQWSSKQAQNSLFTFWSKHYFICYYIAGVSTLYRFTNSILGCLYYSCKYYCYLDAGKKIHRTLVSLDSSRYCFIGFIYI